MLTLTCYLPQTTSPRWAELCPSSPPASATRGKFQTSKTKYFNEYITFSCTNSFLHYCFSPWDTSMWCLSSLNIRARCDIAAVLTMGSALSDGASSLRAAATRPSSATAATSRETRSYKGGRSQCVDACWKTPSHTATSGSDTNDT